MRLAPRAADLVRLCPASSLMNPPRPPLQNSLCGHRRPRQRPRRRPRRSRAVQGGAAPGRAVTHTPVCSHTLRAHPHPSARCVRTLRWEHAKEGLGRAAHAAADVRRRSLKPAFGGASRWTAGKPHWETAVCGGLCTRPFSERRVRLDWVCLRDRWGPFREASSVLSLPGVCVRLTQAQSSGRPLVCVCV